MQLMGGIEGDVVKFLLNLYSAINVVFHFLKYYLSGVFHYKFTDMLFFSNRKSNTLLNLFSVDNSYTNFE